MKRIDYHLHSSFSFDSEEQISNICEKAVQCHVSEIAITDHIEFPRSNEAPWPDFSLRRKVIEENRKKYEKVLTIRSGAEIGQGWRNPNQMREIIEQEQFDFVLASVHYLESFGNPRTFPFTHDNILPFFQEYFQLMRQMAEQCDFDCIAHVTYLFRFVPEKLLYEFPPESFEEEYRNLFKILVSRGKGIEINCSGIRMPNLQTTLPSPQILEIYRQCGGRIITIGSDGHSVRSAFSGIEQGMIILKEVGFQELSCYRNRNLFFQPIE